MDNKKALATNFNADSSAENVEQHLKELEKEDYETLYYSQEQTFSAEELAKVINKARLNKLLAQSDAFLNGLNSEIEGFDDNNNN